jgi:putative tryptophan/tyrosine transport system substrate-binding protein
MKRREFIGLVGGAVAAWPLAARAQQAGKVRTIGYLGADEVVWSSWTAAFVARLSELGWIEGRTVTIEYRWSEARPERVAEIAAEFARLRIDLIVTNGSAVPGIRQVTSDIPIVFAIANDPVGAGMVTSLAHPGGNATGNSLESSDIAGKRVELLRTVVPNLHRFAIMFDAGYPQAVIELGEIKVAAQKLGLDAVPLEIRRAQDIAPAFDALIVPVDALYVIQDSLVGSNRTRILTLALGARLPTMFNSREFVQAGALMSYGPDYPALFRRAADSVDKILRGTKAGDIPVEQPTKFELAVNLTTAKALGLKIPESFLALADQVIE